MNIIDAGHVTSGESAWVSYKTRECSRCLLAISSRSTAPLQSPSALALGPSVYTQTRPREGCTLRPVSSYHRPCSCTEESVAMK
ncbi:hypothetical protein Pmani_014109 [Petrolisthes manimaculis]|uniref:Uncharacterized protein n=1 Tax=Petrolisthes manimaculis TaxID=1843537 RepID=A0AAE1PU84_9EUCA|nr:hypothetical protein Pmani_014109 [Petrolisthes manimaculis]